MGELAETRAHLGPAAHVRTRTEHIQETTPQAKGPTREKCGRGRSGPRQAHRQARSKARVRASAARWDRDDAAQIVWLNDPPPTIRAGRSPSRARRPRSELTSHHGRSRLAVSSTMASSASRDPTRSGACSGGSPSKTISRSWPSRAAHSRARSLVPRGRCLASGNDGRSPASDHERHNRSIGRWRTGGMLV